MTSQSWSRGAMSVLLALAAGCGSRISVGDDHDSTPATHLDSSVSRVCTPGQDRTCNDDQNPAAVLGTCLPDGTCSCKKGFVIRPKSGRCVEATDGGAPKICTPGQDQTCNDDPLISSLWGTCLPATETCSCKTGYVVSASSGRCTPVGPVKVVLMIDTSGSMQWTDPATTSALPARQTAAAQLVKKVLAQPGATMAIVLFNGKLVVNDGKVDALTRDPQVLQGGVDSAGKANLTTDYQGALRKTRQLVDADLGAMSSALRARTRVVAILLTDGAANPVCQAGCDNDPDTELAPGIAVKSWCDLDRKDWCTAYKPADCADMETWFPALQTCGAYNTTASLTDEVGKLITLKTSYGVGEVRLHTVFLTSCYALGEFAKTLCGDLTLAPPLLNTLATAGLGTYTEVADASKISFTGFDLSPLP